MKEEPLERLFVSKVNIVSNIGIEYKRVVYKNKETGSNVVKYLTPGQALVPQTDGEVELEKLE